MATRDSDPVALEDCVRDLARAAIAPHSESFGLPARLLPPETCDLAALLYAYCRRADDAIDSARDHELTARIDELRAELDAVYAGDELADPIAAGFQMLVHNRAIPRMYADERLAGLEHDARALRYESRDDLLRHCHRVAGTVGLMMCRVAGIGHERALLHASHLGIAMQLTNICRDVLDDWNRGRLYLPIELLSAHGAGWLESALADPFPEAGVAAAARTIAQLLDEADAYYASGDACLVYLSPRCALAIRTARLIYSEIAFAIRKGGCDPRAGRVLVPQPRRQLMLAARAGAAGLLGVRPAVPTTAPE